MRIDVKKLIDGPIDLEVDCAPADLELEDEEYRFAGPVSGSVNFSLVGNEVLARGEVRVCVEAECSRCLQAVSLPLCARICTTYEHNEELRSSTPQYTDSDEEPAVYFDGETISPQPELREAIMLELPLIPICGETCRGLCPVCGANLNTSPCTCRRGAEESESPLKAAMKKIKLQ